VGSGGAGQRASQINGVEEKLKEEYHNHYYVPHDEAAVHLLHTHHIHCFFYYYYHFSIFKTLSSSRGNGGAAGHLLNGHRPPCSPAKA